MKRDPVQSSNLAALGYDAARRVLEVEFREAGSIWQYAGVTPEQFRALLEAPSIGSHFARSIRGRGFTARKVARNQCAAHFEHDPGRVQWCDLEHGHAGSHEGEGRILKWFDRPEPKAEPSP